MNRRFGVCAHVLVLQLAIRNEGLENKTNPFFVTNAKCERGFVLAQAFILVNAEVGSEDEVVRELRKIENVKESFLAYGAYDIVVRLEAESMEKLKETIYGKIRRLSKVRTTLTMIVVE